MREDEQGIGGQDDFDDLVRDVTHRVGGDGEPPLRVKCPACGSKFPIALPDGISAVPTNGDQEPEEAADHAVTAQCPACDREMQVVAPRGYRFRDSEGATGDIARHDEAKKASEALVQHFLRRFLGRPGPDDGRSALDTFREAYGTARRDGRLPALPPD